MFIAIAQAHNPMKTSLLILMACFHAALCPIASAQLPTISITATDAAAAERLAGESANPGNIRIARTGSTAGALTVYFKAVSGTAVRGEDYNFGIPLTTWVAIPAGSSSLDIAVNVLDDWLTEGDETVRIDLDSETPGGTPAPYTISGASRATVNIADNEDPLAPLRAIVTVAAIDPIATENPGGTDPAVFRITRTNNLAPTLNILYSLGGTATAGVDYTSPPATITIPAGVAFVDVPIVPIDDPLIETQESVTLTILPTDIVAVPSPAEAYALGATTTGTATIVSNDLPPAPVVTMTSPGPSAASASGQPLTVNFTASAVDGYIVSYQVFGGTGASGVTNLPATTTPGTAYTGTATITLTGNYSMQQVSVRVTNSNGVSATSAGVGVYVFVAPPPPPPPPVLPIINIYPLDAEGAEAAGGSNPASFRVTHNFPASSTVGFLFAIGGSAKEGTDYTLSSAGVSSSFLGRWFTFPAGTTEAIINVNPVDDLLIENTETVTLSLYEPPFIGFNEGGPQGYDPGTFGFYWGPNYAATVNILDNDTAPPPFPVVTIAATDPSGTETQDGSDPAVFTVTRNSGPTDVPLTVNYALTSIPPPYPYIYPLPAMATNGVDFPALSGAVTIPSGATSADIVILPTYDGFVEPNESVRITLRPSAVAWPGAGGYVLDDGTVATAVIHDATLAPGTPIVSIRASDSQAYESTAPSRTGAFVVQRSGSVTDALTVTYTIGGSATNGVDYVTLPASVTIPAGSTIAQIIVDPIDDIIEEAIEFVSLTLQPPAAGIVPAPYALSGANTLQRSAAVSIRDTYVAPLNRYQRARLIRFGRTALIPRAVVPTGTVAPAAALATAPGAAAIVASATSWVVEASADLSNWQEIGTVDSTEEFDEFVDVNAGDFGARFYRFRQAPPASAP